jgi:hypothetical protein
VSGLSDGPQRLQSLFTVLVTPLQPPFPSGAMYFKFDNFDKQLAVSKRDGEKIKKLLSDVAELSRSMFPPSI